MINKILLDFLKENKLSYFLYFISLSYIPISRVAMPHMYGKLIGSLKPLKINVTLKFLILLILLWIFIQLIHTGSNMLYGKVIPKFNSFTRTRIIDEIINRYQNNYKDLFVGNIITKLIKAPWILEDIFNEIENFIFSNILVIVTSFFYLFYYNKILGVMYLIFMVFIFAICILFSNSCSDHFSKNEKIFDNSHEEIEDMLSNLISVYTSKKNCYEKGRVAYLSKGILKSEQKTNKCVQKYRMIYSFIFVIIFAILNIYSLKIFLKKINVSTLSAIIIINYSLLNTFMTIYRQTRRFIELKGRLSVLKTFLENMPDLDESEKQSIDNIQNLNITIQNMGFYYIPKNIF